MQVTGRALAQLRETEWGDDAAAVVVMVRLNSQSFCSHQHHLPPLPLRASLRHRSQR
jgi:hypothetical protein